MKLDLGCGPHKKEGFVGVDSINFPDVDICFNLGRATWPFEDDSVDEAYSCHMIEHLTAPERIHFVNELYRIMKVGAVATIIVPHWCNTRAYGDLTHQWPPVSEFWFNYLDKEWRANNAPHSTYNLEVNFHTEGAMGLSDEVSKVQPHDRDNVIYWGRDSVNDIIATMTKR
jgi:hypothetical protein